MLMAFVAYADQFTGRASNLVDCGLEPRLPGIQGERLAEIVFTPTEADADGSYVGPMPEPSLSLDCVSFRYAEAERWVVLHCSLSIDAGEALATVGPSGCGKSTQSRLMFGLLDPEEGASASAESGSLDWATGPSGRWSTA